MGNAIESIEARVMLSFEDFFYLPKGYIILLTNKHYWLSDTEIKLYASYDLFLKSAWR